MAASETVHVVEDSRFREHLPPPDHPERPERLLAVGQALSAFRDHLTPVPARPAETDELLRVHSQAHLHAVEQAVRAAPGHLDADTFVSPRSLEVATLAAGGVIDLARLVAGGEARCGLAAVRPPGHHAEAERAMGFCLFNNVAIAARALQAECGLDRIMIVDWDVHHGNGTQHIFDEDPSVLYFSTHQFPFYPGTGDSGEIGHGRGAGTTVNVPMPAGCGDDEYLAVFRQIAVPVARHFGPQILLVSCGFDAHWDDPLAGMQVSQTGFFELARIVRALADEICEGRLVFALEGGYSPTGLGEGTTALLSALTEPVVIAIPEKPDVPATGMTGALIGRVAAAHRSRIPSLGIVDPL
ncbi:MAG: histone deacetylase [Myxococcota bacterium]